MSNFTVTSDKEIHLLRDIADKAKAYREAEASVDVTMSDVDMERELDLLVDSDAALNKALDAYAAWKEGLPE